MSENMVLLTAENIRKSYGTRVIFDDISFSIHEGDKIGVIGVNGTGKSTLLKIIAGVDQADSGTIVTMNGMRIGYLSQSPVFVDGTTVLQQVFRGENPQLALVREYEETMAALAKTPEDERLVKRAAELAEKMDKAEAWSLESEAKTILTKLGISDFGQTVETLSGGQKKRVALAAALIAPVDLLILDEPTNHIDNDTVDWLEKHLEKYSKALLMVTHDRYFLDRVANRTLELEQGKLYSRIAELEEILQHVVIVDESNAPTNVVTIGCKVTVADKNGNTMPAYRIVGSQESDPMNGIISEESPFGKALVGAKEGDTVTVEAPSGAIVYTVQKIER